MMLLMAKMRKSQITMFIVIGIAVLAVLGLMLYMASTTNVRQSPSSERSMLQAYAESCATAAGEEALEIIGRQGGRISITGPSEKMPYSNVSYAYYGGKDTLPTLDEIREELESFVSIQMAKCLENINATDSRFSSGGNQRASAVLTEKLVVIDVELQLAANSGKGHTSLNSVSVEIPVRLKKIHALAESIAKQKILYPSYIDMGLLGRQDMDIYVLNYGEYQVYVISDPQSSLSGEPYRFMLAAQN
jgi:hypothetical protein